MTAISITYESARDAIGRRPVLLASVALVGTGSLATALCTDVTTVMLTRFITGIGIGGVTVMCLSLEIRHTAVPVVTQVPYAIGSDTPAEIYPCRVKVADSI